MDHPQQPAPDSSYPSNWQQFEQLLFRAQNSSSGNIYPDQSLETGRDPLLAENFYFDLSADDSLDEELSKNMNNANGIEARFQNLLKNRLLQEMESHPPRFPWENGSEVYLMDEQFVPDSLLPPLLHPQLAAFNLPFNLPESVLNNLVGACSQAMQSLEPQGVRLVQAVQELFAVDKLILHQLAQWVMTAPAPSRSGQSAVLEGNFETANEQQRVAMSMIAAKAIMDRLMISLSATQTKGEFLWETTAGKISVKASYLPQGDTDFGHVINLAIALPRGGQAVWESDQGAVSALRMYPGELRLTLMDCQLNGVYPVKITLNQAAHESLTVAIALKAD